MLRSSRVVSEVQIHENCLLPGENTLWSFGQVMSFSIAPSSVLKDHHNQTAAILLALAPAWALVVATYRYPGTVRQKREEKQKRSEEEWRCQEEEARLATRRCTTSILMSYGPDELT